MSATAAATAAVSPTYQASRAVSPASPAQPERPSAPAPSRASPPAVLSKVPSPTRPNVMFSVLGGMRKSVETFSSEAASVLSRVTGGASHEAAALASAPEDAAPAAQVRFSPPPEPIPVQQPKAASPDAATAGPHPVQCCGVCACVLCAQSLLCHTHAAASCMLQRWQLGNVVARSACSTG